MNKLTHWSYHRQYLGRRGKNAVQVLKDIVGVYSWHPSAPLSLWNRLPSFNKKKFNTLDQERLAIRVPAMRLSNYMLERGMAPLVFSAAILPAKDPYWEKRYGKFISPEKYQVWKEEILDHLQKPASLAEIKEAAIEVPSDRLKFILNRMAFEGIVLRIGSENMRSNIIQYVATESWTESSLDISDSGQSLIKLASAYFNAFGPARIKDFQWWSGVTMSKVKQALSELETIDIGDGNLLQTLQKEDFDSFKPVNRDNIDLLPQWDSYIMGYAPDGRERFVAPDMQDKIYGKIGATGGNGLGTILVNGMAHGSWKAKIKGNQVSFQLNMFEKPSTKLNETIKEKFIEMASFMEIKKVIFSNDL